MNQDQKLDEILAIVRNIGSLDAEVIATRNALDEAQKSETDGNRAWQELHEKAVEVTLKAYDLFESIAKVPGMPKEFRGRISRERSDFMDFCREHIWAPEDDPYYDPNANRD